jgi:hypothetical protein
MSGLALAVIVIVVLIVLAVLLAVVLQLPELRRYMKIRQM